MKADKIIPPPRLRQAQRSGTTLLLGSGRQIRVLPLPKTFGHHHLRYTWEACFGTEAPRDLLIWWPLSDPQLPHLN